LGNYRKQRFRKILIPLEDLQARAPAWQAVLRPVKTAWKRPSAH